MAETWQSALRRWREAGLIDAPSAESIRKFEEAREQPRQFRWPILIAIGLGSLMLGAGVLLFVSAHWDELSPGQRFSLVLLLVSIFHVAGAVLSKRFEALSTALHGLGTIALGAGIFLSAQIFNLAEHWPGGVMLWAIGAWIGWALLRDWVQAALAAILTPAWLASEWIDATDRYGGSERVISQAILLLAVAYLGGLFGEHRGPVRRAMAWIGGIAIIPAALVSMPHAYYYNQLLSTKWLVIGLVLGFGLPLLLAVWLRGKAAWVNVVAACWVAVLAVLPEGTPNVESGLHYGIRIIGPYAWSGLASLALIAWGMMEARRERINLGIFGFGLTVLAFYFSEVMDKLGRSASLIGLGLLFLVLAWGLERTRRQLVAKVKGAAA